LALPLLRGLAKDDAVLADRMRRLGLDLTSACGIAGAVCL